MKAILMEFLDLYKTSFIIIIAIIAFTVQVIVFNDPPSFPLSHHFDDSIDCFNIISSSITIDKSRIKVRMDVKDFIQYPIEVASSMVHIESKVGNVNFSFPPNIFWDLVSDKHHISFCVLQTAAGDVEASLYCQNTLLSKTINKVNSLDAYPVGWSRIFEDQYFSGVFYDVCFNSNSKLVFCSKQSAVIGNIRASYSEEVPVFITSQSAANYQQSERIPRLETFSVFVPYNSKNEKTYFNTPIANAQNFLFDTVLPIFGSLEFSPTTFITSNKKIYNQLAPILGSKVQLLSKSCHKKLAFLPTTGSYNILTKKNYNNFAQSQSIHTNFLFSLKKTVFDSLREFYSTQSNSSSDNTKLDQKYDVVLDQGISRFLQSLKNNLSSSYNIFVISDKHSFNMISNIVRSAKVVVASDIKTLFFGALMNKNSTLIEVSPEDMNCISFKNYLSPKFDVNYEVVQSKSKKCKCIGSKDLECYFGNQHNFINIDKRTLFNTIKASLN